MKTTAKVALPVILIIAILAATACSQRETRLSGIVRATEYRLGSRVGGTVAEHLVSEGEVAPAGAMLARLDDAVLLAQRNVLAAAAEAAWATFRDMKAGATPEEVRRARAELAGAEAQYSQALEGFRDEDIRAAAFQRDSITAKLAAVEKNTARLQHLYDEGVVAASELDAAVAERDGLRSQLAAAQANLDKLTKGLRPQEISAAAAAAGARKAVLDQLLVGPTANQLAAAEARARQADAQIAALELDLAGLTVTAPTQGLVEDRLLDAGETAAPGAALLTFVSTEEVWIDTFVPESKLASVKLGAKLQVELDAMRDQPFEAEVFFISRDAEFTPRNISTPEERVNQVYRVKLRPLSPPVELRTGMTASVFLGQ